MFRKLFRKGNRTTTATRQVKCSCLPSLEEVESRVSPGAITGALSWRPAELPLEFETQSLTAGAVSSHAQSQSSLRSAVRPSSYPEDRNEAACISQLPMNGAVTANGRQQTRSQSPCLEALLTHQGDPSLTAVNHAATGASAYAQFGSACFNRDEAPQDSSSGCGDSGSLGERQTEASSDSVSSWSFLAAFASASVSGIRVEARSGASAGWQYDEMTVSGVPYATTIRMYVDSLLAQDQKGIGHVSPNASGWLGQRSLSFTPGQQIMLASPVRDGTTRLLFGLRVGLSVQASSDLQTLSSYASGGAWAWIGAVRILDSGGDERAFSELGVEVSTRSGIELPSE